MSNPIRKQSWEKSLNEFKENKGLFELKFIYENRFIHFFKENEKGELIEIPEPEKGCYTFIGIGIMSKTKTVKENESNV